ncbi:hypothetical protein [Metabacillus niabensis]|uniref:hypothetical protein n=1 Tax=Metabacillus niabensis TaxID=324854 RepID=UPI0039A0FAFF
MNIKLKCVYLKKDETNKLQGNEANSDELVTLRVGGEKKGRFNYHHFRVPLKATVEIHYEIEKPKGLLRLIFHITNPDLSIHYYQWNDEKQCYLGAPLEQDIIKSSSFQRILQGISFSGKKHFSYIVNPPQRLKDLLN